MERAGDRLAGDFLESQDPYYQAQLATILDNLGLLGEVARLHLDFVQLDGRQPQRPQGKRGGAMQSCPHCSAAVRMIRPRGADALAFARHMERGKPMSLCPMSRRPASS